MLGSGKLKTITSERTLLKNLGAWLGKLTLANNRPVLQVRQAALHAGALLRVAPHGFWCAPCPLASWLPRPHRLPLPCPLLF